MPKTSQRQATDLRSCYKGNGFMHQEQWYSESGELTWLSKTNEIRKQKTCS